MLGGAGSGGGMWSGYFLCPHPTLPRKWGRVGWGYLEPGAGRPQSLIRGKVPSRGHKCGAIIARDAVREGWMGRQAAAARAKSLLAILVFGASLFLGAAGETASAADLIWEVENPFRLT